MNPELVIVAVVVGLGTWLFRFLPTRMRGLSGARGGWVERATESIGPAAIATLFIASVIPDLTSRDSGLIAFLSGAAATAVVFAGRRSVALATIAGAVAYGVAFALVAG